MAKRPSFIFLLALLTLPMVLLSGCATKEGWEGWELPDLPKFTPLGSQERADWTSIRRANYAAADVLYQRAEQYLDRFHKVELVKLNNLGEPLAEGTAPIAWLVPQQVGSRLAHLGLNVDQPKKAPLNSADKRADGTLPLQLVKTEAVKSQPKRKPGHLYVEGDYIYLEDELLVSLRLVSGRTNNILSSIEYDQDVDANMFALINPAAQDKMFSAGWMY